MQPQRCTLRNPASASRCACSNRSSASSFSSAAAITSRTRLNTLPQLPTVAESGVPGFESGQWYGVFVPAGTPAGVIIRLQSELAKVVQQPAVAEQITRQGSFPVADTPQQFGV